jgi:ribokinase
MTNLSVVCVGAAVQDVFLHGKVLTPIKDDEGEWVEEIKLGAKLDLDDITFSTGGGATNGAVTFAKQGFHAKLAAKIGHDPAGVAVISDMKKYRINTDLVTYSNKFQTGYSALLVAPSGERSILTYRGASSSYRLENFDFPKIEGDWMFITSLAGNMEVLEALINHAESRHMKVALIPGKGELNNADWLKSLLPKVHILSANVEEMQMLFEGSNKEELAKNASKVVNVAVVTDGPGGVAACDRQMMITAGMYEDVPVVDRTGAGDAFASGFVAKYALGASLQDCLIFASANSTSVVGQMGAKIGILNKDAEIHSMEIWGENLGEGY